MRFEESANGVAHRNLTSQIKLPVANADFMSTSVHHIPKGQLVSSCETYHNNYPALYYCTGRHCTYRLCSLRTMVCNVRKYHRKQQAIRTNIPISIMTVEILAASLNVCSQVWIDTSASTRNVIIQDLGYPFWLISKWYRCIVICKLRWSDH